MNPLFSVEYRGYITYDIDNLVNTGQAAALGHGPGRRGAYNWIDNRLGDDSVNPKPAPEIRERIMIQNEALHAARKARDDFEAKRRANFDKWH